MDLVVTGCSSGAVRSCITVDKGRIYINNGTSLVENSTWETNLTGVSWGSLALGDIDNDGRLDLVISGSNDGSNGFDVKVYINNRTSLVENSTWETNLTINMYAGSLALGDIDNDGRLDLVISGSNETGRNGVYINNGTSFMKNSTWIESLPWAGYATTGGASLALGDIDNDGDLDLLMLGSRGTNFFRGVYINNRTSLVENTTWETNFNPIFGYPSISLSNWNNDDYLDFASIGVRAGDHFYIFENNGTNFIVNTTETSSGSACVAGYYDGSLAWGDYNNDGDLDIVVIGLEEGRTRVYGQRETNEFGCIFFADATAHTNISNNIVQGSLAWGDYNNDGDLDLVVTGDDNGNEMAKVYINNITTPNTSPNPPTSDFDSTYFNGQLTLTWSSGSDTETPTAGLYYNLRVGTSSGSNNIVSGVYGGSSNPTAGYFGNMMQRKSITLNIPDQNYYWSVQTIDTGLAKSSWSTEQIYTQGSDSIEPTITIHALVDNFNTSNTSVTFNVTVYDNIAVKNVTLYGNWSTGWHENRTNSSGFNNTPYIFNNTLPEGTYKWKIRACDTSNNCMSTNNRTFVIDTTRPFITLISPSNASTWSSSSTVTFSYNVSDRAVANCSLIINSAVDQTNSSITVNTTQTFSKSLSNAAYNWSVNCTDYAGLTNSSITRQLTVSYTAPSTAVTTGGGSSGGTAIISTEQGNIVIRKFTSITEYTPKTITESTLQQSGTKLTELYISVTERTTNVEITISKLEQLPSAISSVANVYEYINITKQNLEDKIINQSTISFKVEKNWTDTNTMDPNTISLYRYTTLWDKLATEKISEDNNYYYYKATTPGFSYFAISGEKTITPTTTTTTQTTTTTTTPAPTITIPTIITEFPTWIIYVITVTIAGIIVLIFRMKIWKKKK